MAEESALESEVNNKESKGLIAKAIEMSFNVSVAVGTTAFGMMTAGVAAPIVASAFAGGGLLGRIFSKKETPFFKLFGDTLKTYSAVNTVYHPMGMLANATMPLVAKAGAGLIGYGGPFIAKSLYSVTAYNWTFITAFKGVHHLYDNAFNPKGIVKSVKTDFWPLANRFSWIFAPGYILAANGVSNLNIFGYKAPTFAVNAAPAAIYNGINPPKSYSNQHGVSASHPNINPNYSSRQNAVTPNPATA